ncbi:MAG: TetR family transcriptional regulator, partial [Gammaproteobacteria bacterium]
MPRPSLKTQRTGEILDAFQRCIVKYGMQGASLERISEEADMGRTILRHYVGNRDDLIIAV